MVDFFEVTLIALNSAGLPQLFIPITASVIQGSAIRPALFVANAADLTPVTAGNSLSKYADVTYLIVPAINADSRTLELDNIEEWTKANNLSLTLNRGKSAEIVIIDRKRKCHDTYHPSPA